MKYVTIRQASEKWGVAIRQVQNLCEKGRVQGAIRFNHSWAIPEKAEKPVDRRKKESEGRSSASQVRPDFLSGDARHLLQIIAGLPYGVSICDKDGIMVYANDAFMEGVLDDARKSAIGSYDLKQEKMLEKWGIKEHVEKALKGEYVFTPNLELPIHDLVGIRYRSEYTFVSIYLDMTSYPILDADGKLAYIAFTFVPVKRYQSRKEVARGKEYIESHWLQPFNAELAAKAAYLSLSRFTTIFREEVGFSPHEYYNRIKIQKLKEKLLDSSMSISQVFSECGVAYNSHYTKLFRKHTGLTSTQFRKNNKNSSILV